MDVNLRRSLTFEDYFSSVELERASESRTPDETANSLPNELTFSAIFVDLWGSELTNSIELTDTFCQDRGRRKNFKH